MNQTNPYQAPETEPLEDGSYRPSGVDWLFLLLFLPFVCLTAFFVSCIGAGYVLFVIVFSSSKPNEIVVFLPFVIGLGCAIFVGWLMGSRYVRMQKGRHESRKELDELLSKEEPSTNEFS